MVIRSVVNAFQLDLPPEFWQLSVAPLISTIINSGLVVAAGIGIWKRLSWGWWLAGIYLCNRILRSILGFISLFTIRINGELMYLRIPEILFSTTAILIVSLCLLSFLYTRAVRDYLHTSDVRKAKSLSIFFGYAFLLVVLFIALMLLPNLLMYSN